MNPIFKKNSLLALSYTFIIIGFSLLFDRSNQSLILNLYDLIAGTHFIITGIYMAINQYKANITKRNAYMASFGLIWLLIILVQGLNFYLAYENQLLK